MKQKKHFGKRVLSLLLCLMMIVCMLPAAAFADDAPDGGANGEQAGGEITLPAERDEDADDDADVDADGGDDEADDATEPTVIPATEAPIPEDADVQTTTIVSDSGDTTTKKTDTTWEYKDEEKKDEENKKLEEEGKSDYGESNPADVEGDDRETADKLLNGTDLDQIQDGTYTKHDEQTKQEVTDVTVEGEQHRTDVSTVDSEGRPDSDSFSVEGSQTTTATTETTTKTTTTEVTKDTDVEHSDKEFEQPGSETAPDYVEGSEKTTETGGPNGLEVTDPNAPVTGAPVAVQTDRTDNGVKVTMNQASQWAGHGNGTQSVTLPGSEALLSGLNGWTVETTAKDGTPVKGVVADGKVIVGGQEYEVGLVSKDGGQTYQFGLKATLDETNSTDKRENLTQSSDKNVNVSVGDQSYVDENGATQEGKNTTPGTPELKEENKGEYVLVKDENGELVYVKKDTWTREDQNRWTQVTGITEEDFLRIVKTFERSIDIAVGGPVQVNATTTITTGADDGKLNLVIANPKTGQPMNITNLSGSEYTYVGHEYVESGLMVGWTWQNGNDYRGNTSIYKLQDKNGKIIYGYCVEKGVSLGTEGTTSYEFVNITDAVNSSNTSYEKPADKPATSGSYITADDLSHLNYISEKGYWGGNLEAVKGLVREEYRGYITEDIAKSITQAAIWAYADAANRDWGYPDGIYDYSDKKPSVSTVTYKDLDGNTHTVDNVFPWTYNAGSTVSGNKAKACMALYNALISGTSTGNQTDLDNAAYRIESTDITQTTITVKEKVNSTAELDAVVAQANANADRYNVDASMTMAIVPSNFGGVMLYVYVNGERVAGSRLTGEQATKADGSAYSHQIGLTGSGNSWTYSVSGLEIAEGVTVNFKLEGGQELGEGMYLLQNDTYQNFATVIKSGSTRTVDINVALGFSVDKGQSTISDAQSGKTEQDAWTVRNTTTKDFTSTTTREDEVTTTVTVTTKVSSVEDVTETKQSVVEALAWSDSDIQYYTYTTPGDGPSENDDDDDNDIEIPDPRTPLDEFPEEAELPEEDVELPEDEIPLDEMPEEEIELPDDEIPLADVPQTGDISVCWYVMAALSAAGLIGLTAVERKKGR